MPLDTAVVGSAAGERQLTVSARQCMAYAAGTEDANPRYFDDAGPGGVLAPPLFGVSLDWALRPALTALLRLTPEESARGVHATQEMIFHRPIRAGDELTVRGVVTQAEARRPGAYLVTRYETTDASGAPVLTVYYGSLFRGVAVSGPARRIDPPPPLPVRDATEEPPCWLAPLQVSPYAPHVYTECAAIYNPIHTERSAALAAGLPEIIVHGTLTLAYAARELLNREAAGDPTRLRRIACRFAGMVLPGAVIRVRLDGARAVAEDRALFFSVVGADGAAAIRDGVALVSV